MRTGHEFWNRLGYFRWVPHNIFAHPVSEVLSLVGFEKAGNWIHDITLPAHSHGTGRG